MSPFKDQIAPHVSRLLLLKKTKIAARCIFNHFDLNILWRFLHWIRWPLGQSNTRPFGLFLKTLPGFDASHLHLSCYTGTDMPGEWTPSPVALETSAETMQQVSEKCSIIRDAIDVQKADAWVPIWGSSKLWKSRIIIIIEKSLFNHIKHYKCR